MQNRKTINSSANSPAYYMLNFNLRTKMDLLNTTNNNYTCSKFKETKFKIGDEVIFRNYDNRSKWKIGIYMNSSESRE